ncbi:MAG: Histidine kinase, gyrase and HSP90-like ATPase, partial [Verrucomicrobiaceae bacterium]|nr:Histidine kinase, gyrase and HSP90-like ATPase [Verrucomicrobiaceae bacterium]
MRVFTMNFSLQLRRGFLLDLVAVLDPKLRHSRMQVFLRYAILIGLWGLAAAARAEGGPKLQNISDVQKDVARPGEVKLVKVRGAVTYRKDAVGIAFVQDKTGGIAFYPRGVESGKQTGKPDVVEIIGVPMVNDGMLMLCGVASTEELPVHPVVSYLPDERLDIKLRKIELSMLTDLRTEAELVQTAGVMRRVIQKTKTGMTVEVTSPGSYVVVRLPWLPPEEEVGKWINRQISFKGVIACRAEKRLLPADADAVVFVSNPEDWVLQPGVIEKVLASP